MEAADKFQVKHVQKRSVEWNIDFEITFAFTKSKTTICESRQKEMFWLPACSTSLWSLQPAEQQTGLMGKSAKCEP